MKYTKSLLSITLVAASALSSCSGLPKGAGGGGGGGGSSTAKVSLTMVSDTLPANGIGIVSFKVTISSVLLTSSTGATSTLDLGGLNNGKGLIVDLARAQSDSIFLGTISSVPTGTNASIAVSFTSAELVFYNGTGSAITSLTPQCPSGDVCVASFNTTGTPVITASQGIGANTGFGIDFNLANAITLSGTTLSLNLTNSGTTNVISSFALPRNPNLTAGQLDLIEDFTGVVTLSGTSVTIASPNAAGRGSITAASGPNTNYDQDPTLSLCPFPETSLSGCVSSNQAASMDAILNSDGTFTIQEIEPLLPSPLVDTVEGTIVSNANNGTQFSIVTTDIIPAATSSKISSLNLGDPVLVNLSNVIPTGFYVDTKGFAVGGALSNFQGQTTTAALQLGQSVAIHIASFTAASGNTIASANTDSVTLRWSRFIAPPVGASSAPLFNVNTLPGYFGFSNPVATFEVQIFLGSVGGDGVTNLDGIANGGTVAGSPSVGVRALFIEDAGDTLTPAFFAAKVRQQ
jgi:hypothetical protein